MAGLQAGLSLGYYVGYTQEPKKDGAGLLGLLLRKRNTTSYDVLGSSPIAMIHAIPVEVSLSAMVDQGSS